MAATTVITDAVPELSVNGLLSTYNDIPNARGLNQISGNCFSGMGMFDCVTAEGGVDINNYNTPYYNSLYLLKGQSYCLQCCGTDPDLVDDWTLFCPVADEADVNTMIYADNKFIGPVFRFGVRKSKVDVDYVECALQSPACNYSDTGETLECDAGFEGPPYIVGYDLYLRVEQYMENFDYWRGVSSCEAFAITRDTPLVQGEYFQERIHMDRTARFQGLDMPRALILLSLLGFFVVVACYFCRRDTCVICQERLVLFFHRCLLCRLLGAHIPDPKLLEALRTKGEYIQNESERPERFPGAKACVATVRFLYSLVTLRCFDYCRKKTVEPTNLNKKPEDTSEPPDKGCCRGDDPDEASCFEVFCCCLVFLYKCCCKKRKPKPKRIQVVELPLQPYMMYDTLRHPLPPSEVKEAKETAVADAQYKEDLELYGDLTLIPEDDKSMPKQDTEAYQARRRMTVYKQANAQHAPKGLLEFVNNLNSGSGKPPFGGNSSRPKIGFMNEVSPMVSPVGSRRQSAANTPLGSPSGSRRGSQLESSEGESERLSSKPGFFKNLSMVSGFKSEKIAPV